MNNLDPDVAERPDDLVVYGGTGRAARDWASFDAIVRTLTTLEVRRDAAGPVRSPGRRDAHPRVGAAGADRQLQPRRRLGDLAGVPPAGAPRPDHVRPDDRRLLDLHRHPGHPAGHLRDLRRRRRQAVRRHPRRHADRHRRAAAGWAAPSRSPSPSTAASASSSTSTRTGCTGAPSTGYLDEVAAGLDDALRGCWRPRPSGGRCPSGWSATAPSVLPELLRRGVRRRHRHRPDLRPRPAELPARGRGAGGLAPATPRPSPEEFTARARASMARHVEAMVGFLDAGAEVFDYGNSIRDEARQGGYERAFDFPGFVPAYIRPLFCEGKGPFRWAALSGDPRDIAGHRPRRARTVPRRRAPAPLDRGPPASGSPSRACPPGSAGSGTASATRAGLRFNELVASGRGQPPRS